jgi:hypothetical protein
MTSAIMMERAGLGMSSMPVSNPSGMLGAPATTPNGMNVVMVPRCTMTFKKCAGGMKITCSCDDKVSATMLQNLCSMMPGGLCSCCCMMNGMMVCCCNLTMAMCKCEPTDDGVCVTCTSGDSSCSAMIEACCACMTSMMKAGCTCCLMINNMPVCCGC